MSRPIPVAYCIGTLGVGGAERHLVQLISRLDRRKWSPHVFAISEGGPLEADLRTLGVPVRILGYEGLRIRRFIRGTWRPVAELLHGLHDVRPAIVHSYLYWANVLGTLAARRAGVPVVITSRRGLGHFKEQRWYYQPLENYTNRLADAITVNSRGVLEDVRRRERHVDGKVHLIYNGVDFQRFATAERDPALLRAEVGVPPGVPVIGCIANLIPYKGHLDLIEALPSVMALVPHLHVVLVGRDGGIQASLEERARVLGVAERVRFLGSRRDVAELLHLFDVVVLPSHEEGFSNVILEGMAAARPLVVTDVGGNAEAVEHGKTGLVVPPRSPQALSAALGELLTDGERARAMGRAGQERVRSHFSLDAMVAGIEALYTALLKSKGMPVPTAPRS
jgi:glycosyltransferase involved in cell wall biosynthesis